MNLKQRFSFLFSLLFSVILATLMLVVYTLFARFRVEEFKDRLEEKAKTTIKLLIDVNEVDSQLLKIIDRNTINKLYNEKIILFNAQFKPIYTSIDNAPIPWTLQDLQSIKKNKSSFRRYKGYEVYGTFSNTNDKVYYALVSADDKYGKRKLTYLQYLLIGAFVISSLLVWLLSYYVSKKGLQPLLTLRNNILEITDKNLNTRLPVTTSNDEIGELSNSFNDMLGRIDTSYNLQKEFASNASHELRTPLARIVTQIENLVHDNSISLAAKDALKLVSEDCYQLSDIISSLFLLSRIENTLKSKGFEKLRLDEIIFSCDEQLKKIYPNFKFHFEIERSNELNIEVEGDETLLKIAIENLLKNGYHYSSDGIVRCLIKPGLKVIEVHFTNRGEVPDVPDTSLLFNSFTRGKNVFNRPGSGLGLSIVKRILYYHNADIIYNIPAANTNELIISFNLLPC